MPTQANQKVPKIRFRSFEGLWVDKVLGEIGQVAMNKRIFKHQTSPLGDVPFFKIGSFGGVPDAFISRALFEDYKKRYPYPSNGDVLISASGSIGRVVEYQGQDEYFQDSNIVWLEHDGQIENTFLKQFYWFVKWEGLEGSTIKRLYNKNILQTKIILPILEEQIQIGNYFRHLDQLIDLHQRKHEKLLTLKKAMLQKMFPQAGATTPEIRFKGFLGDWEEREFGRIAGRSNQYCSEKELPRIEYEDIISGSGCLNKSLFKKKSQKAGIKFMKGAVLFGKLRPYLRNWWLAEFEGIAVGDFWVFESDLTNSGFLYCLIQTKAFDRIANQSAGSKMPRSDWKLVSMSRFRIPVALQEQQKIGTYFRKVDDLIAKHAIQLQKLKQIKSACLEKMFV
jgi:type I restriction enzyme, S subunit